MLMFKKDCSYGKGSLWWMWLLPQESFVHKELFVLSCLKTVEVSSIWKTFLRYSDIYKDI